MLKDLYALDDGAASLAAGRDLGSALHRMGLVHLLLSFLLAMGPIPARGARAAAPAAAIPNAAEQGTPSYIRDSGLVASVKEAAAGLPKRQPYMGFRTDIVAGAPPCGPTLLRTSLGPSCQMLGRLECEICLWAVD